VLAELPHAEGLGVDISQAALEVAAKNCTAMGLGQRAKFQESFLLGGVHSPFDVIVTNLPYIGTETFDFVAENTYKFEPHSALFAGSDGLDLYRQLFQQIHDSSWQPRLFLGEFGFGQSEMVQGLLAQHFPQAHRKILQDYAGIDRVFVVENA
jgi:release factor glutamine methyltransferase